MLLLGARSSISCRMPSDESRRVKETCALFCSGEGASKAADNAQASQKRQAHPCPQRQHERGTTVHREKAQQELRPPDQLALNTNEQEERVALGILTRRVGEARSIACA